MHMYKLLILPALYFPLLSQADFEYNLTRHKGNRIVLLGEWRAEDSNKWKEVIDSDGVYEHGFTLLNREKLMALESGANLLLAINDGNINAFERWIRQKYGLSAGARWAAFDIENKLIAAGVQAPGPAEFDKLLEQRGIKSPLRKVRDFLAETPNHLEARADLLVEVRRRALHKMPPNAAEDLDAGSDLRIWGVLAAETDRVFSGSWQGIDIRFFAPHKDQPEKFSNLMKNVFRKHISKVESAIVSDPANSTLWNIWAWMARCSPDYNWSSFVNSIGPFALPRRGTAMFPASDVCVWIVDESRKKKDWDTVIKYARLARRFTNNEDSSYLVLEQNPDWTPGGGVGGFFNISPAPIEGYPAKSAYAPHLEALLRLGDIEGANNLYDEMIRLIGKTDVGDFKTENALIAANAARSVGMENIAKIWEQGELIDKSPFQKSVATGTALGSPYYHIFTKDHQTDYANKFLTSLAGVSPRLNITIGQYDDDTFGWKVADGERWGLLSADGRLLAQDTEIPGKDAMQNILIRNNINSSVELYRKYIAEKGSTPGIALLLAYEIIDQNIRTKNSVAGEDSPDGIAWGEAVRLLRDTFSRPEVLLDLSYNNLNPGAAGQSESMKLLSKPHLTNIESLIERKPSSVRLWRQWLFWRSVEGEERPVDPIAERVKLSPLSKQGTLLPTIVMDTYYEECRKSGKWPKVIGLLETVWNRDLRNLNPQSEPEDEMARYFQNYAKQAAASLGDRVGIPLIEAYLNDNRPREASDIFNAWLDSGGKFTNILKIVELAKSKGHESLIREWENKVKK